VDQHYKFLLGPAKERSRCSDLPRGPVADAALKSSEDVFAGEEFRALCAKADQVLPKASTLDAITIPSGEGVAEA